MKKKFNILGIILLSLGLIISSCLNVKAEENYTITIDGAGKNHKFEAYQVFKGLLSTKSEGKDVLSNIVWGSGVNGDNLLNALKNDETTINKMTESGAGGTDTMKNIFASCTTARDVAEVLALYADNSDMTIAFAEVVSTNLTTTKLTSTYKEDTSSYTMTATEPGYYFVKDTSENDKLDTNEFYTRYVLKVVKDQTVKVKGDVPTVEKEVADTNKEHSDTTLNHGETLDNQKVLSAEIGNALEFTLTGTLPSNYEDYDTYKYIFHDTLSKGLTYMENNIKVYKVKHDGTKEDVTTNFTTSNVTNADGTTTVTITINDLKQIISDTEYKADNEITLVIKYYAYLNENAVLGSVGNTNTVNLEFSNDPNKAGSGKTKHTPDEKVTVYTYQLSIEKKDGKSEKVLEGVGFKLYKEVGEQKLYAKVNSTTHTLEEWVENIEDATEIQTDANGHLEIHGLEAATYYLKETTTLPGYNTIGDVKIVITDTLVGNEEHAVTQELTDLKLSVEWVDNTRTQTSSDSTGDKTTGVVKATVLNMPGSILPFTGGMGTVIFYVIGFALIICSFIFVWRKYSKK